MHVLSTHEGVRWRVLQAANRTLQWKRPGPGGTGALRGRHAAFDSVTGSKRLLHRTAQLIGIARRRSTDFRCRGADGHRLRPGERAVRLHDPHANVTLVALECVARLRLRL